MTAPARAALADEVRRVLDGIHDPCSVAASVPMGLDEMDLVERVDVSDAVHVTIHLRLTSPFCEMVPFMAREARQRVGDVPGVTGVDVEHDSGLDWDHDMIAPTARRRRELRLSVVRAQARGHSPVAGRA